MPGVNVTLKGTSNATVTDAQGNYSITVPSSGGTLMFSFIGYVTNEVKIGTSNVINIVLTIDQAELSEVVVAGYAKAKKGLFGRSPGVGVI